MRRCVLVCYDIRDPKRLRRVHKTMKGYGERWQLSIFFCTLREVDRVRMRAELEAAMNVKEDQILIVDLGADEEEARAAAVVLGAPLSCGDGDIMVV